MEKFLLHVGTEGWGGGWVLKFHPSGRFVNSVGSKEQATRFDKAGADEVIEGWLKDYRVRVVVEEGNGE